MKRTCSSEPYRQLAAGILNQAMRDWERHQWIRPFVPWTQAGVLYHDRPAKAHDGLQLARRVGCKTPRQELLTFFRSLWCSQLCQELDIDYGAYLDTVSSKYCVPNRG